MGQEDDCFELLTFLNACLPSKVPLSSTHGVFFGVFFLFACV